MNWMALAILGWGCSFAALAARAQVDMGASVGPEALYGDPKAKSESRALIPPLALALGLALDATSWAAIEVSTPTPAKDIAQLLQKGYYKQELFQIILMARRSGSPLRKLAEDRDKGKRLREIARGLNLEYERIYEESDLWSAEVERDFLPRVTAVSSGAPPASTGGQSSP